jgi:ATP:cob(I)alamin adenosyltransferase
MAKSKIYTRRGDEGYTSLVSGNRVKKSNVRLEAYGTVDELNSFIACLIDEVDDRDDRQYLQRIQCNLFTIGGYLANDLETKNESIAQDEVDSLEKEMDRMDEMVPPLKAFVLPGGCKSNSMAHVCRTVCRRAERAVCQLKDKADIDSIALRYINRLSDYFFLFARRQNILNDIEEIIWEKPCK